MVLKRFPTSFLGLVISVVVLLSSIFLYPGAFARTTTLLRGHIYALARGAGKFKTLYTLNEQYARVNDGPVSVIYARGNGGTASTPAIVLDITNEALPVVASRLNMTDRELPHVTVLVHPDRDSLRRVFGWSATQSASGVYWGGVIRVLSPDLWIENKGYDNLAQEYREEGPIVHELTHLLLDYKTNGNYETWFSEGLAQWQELQLIGWEWTAGEAALRRQTVPFSIMRNGFYQLKDEALAYRQSLRMVQFIVAEAGEDGLQHMVELLARGYSTDEALANILGRTPNQFERDFNQWLSKH